MAGKFVGLALDSTGDILLQSLLFTESQLVSGATNALKQISAAMATAASAPSTAITTLAQFAAAITNTFNSRVSSVYSGMSGRSVGPMLLVEASRALGSQGVPPAGMMTLYALNPGHAADLPAFVNGIIPPKRDVALTQTLVSLGAAA
jgi:surfactin synthase thioesterase subunit